MPYDRSYYPNLGQLKKSLLRSRNEVTNLAALVVGTIEDMILQEDITIPTSAWAANNDAATLAAGYSYKADIAVQHLLENANVNLTLLIPSLSIAAAAKMSKTVDILNDPAASAQAGYPVGIIRFYAKKIPTASLNAKLDAIQLDDSEDEEA